MIRPDARILRDTAALSLASLTIGTSFGVLATSAGIEPVMACVMSLAVFAGGAQFLMVAGVESGALWASVAAALLLNARHLPFAMALAPFMGRTRARRALESHLIVDESAAYALAQPDARSAEHGFLSVGIALFCCWNIGTAFGVLAGSALGDPEALGLDAAFPASLLALLMPQLRRPPAARPPRRERPWRWRRRRCCPPAGPSCWRGSARWPASGSRRGAARRRAP